MKTIDLKGIARTFGAKSEVKKLRNKGEVPCVLYGLNEKNIHFAVQEADLHHLVYTPNAYLINLNIDGTKRTAVIREIQFHPVTDKILHIDFYNVNEDKPVTIDVPVEITGTAEGVRQGGKLHVLNRRVKVSALPKFLPDKITIDISTLKIGKTIVAGDLSYENIQVLTPKVAIICAVKMTRAAIQSSATPAAGTTAPAAAAAAPAAEEKKK